MESLDEAHDTDIKATASRTTVRELALAELAEPQPEERGRGCSPPPPNMRSSSNSVANVRITERALYMSRSPQQLTVIRADLSMAEAGRGWQGSSHARSRMVQLRARGREQKEGRAGAIAIRRNFRTR